VQPDALRMVQEMAQPYLEDMLNGYLRNGVPIPTIEDVKVPAYTPLARDK
jgi:hypothetical protein